MPKGMLNSQARDPKNFGLAEWQQAKRIGKDKYEITKVFQYCWAVSNNQADYAKALKTRGYRLAKGDRRGFVVLDHRCEVFSVSKWSGLKTKVVCEKLGEPDQLPSVTDTRTLIAQEMTQNLTALLQKQDKAIKELKRVIEEKRKALVTAQHQERQQQQTVHDKRCTEETKQSQSHYRKVLLGLLDRVSGNHRQIKQQNEAEALQAQKRD